MDREMIISILLLIIVVVIILIFLIFIIIEERKKLNEIKYYKITIKYSMDYFKYMDMAKEMKKVIAVI